MGAIKMNLRLFNLFRENFNLTKVQAQEFVVVIDESIEEHNFRKHENYKDLFSARNEGNS